MVHSSVSWPVQRSDTEIGDPELDSRMRHVRLSVHLIKIVGGRSACVSPVDRFDDPLCRARFEIKHDVREGRPLARLDTKALV